MALCLARWAPSAARGRGRPTPDRPAARRQESTSGSSSRGLVRTRLLTFCSAYLLFFLMLLSSFRVAAFSLSASTRQQLRRSNSNIHPLVVSSSSSYSSASAPAVVGLHTSATPLQSTTTYECLFDIQVPEGRCVGLALPDLPEEHPDALVGERILEAAARSADDRNSNDNNNSDLQRNHHWIYDHLHADEIRYGLELGPKTQASFWMGRLALRQSLSDLNPCSISTRSILKDAHGRPQLPPGFLGSISHKRNTGVALVALAPEEKRSVDSFNGTTQPPLPRLGVGVDIEETTPKRRSVARKVLTPNEINNLGRLPVSTTAAVV